MIYLEEAWRILLANRLRSALTMLGLIIGVGAVIAIQIMGATMAVAVNGLLGPLSDRSFFIFATSHRKLSTALRPALFRISVLWGSSRRFNLLDRFRSIDV